MGNRDPRVDAYVHAAPPFAQPILAHLRDLVHAACPQAAETIKWGMPHFEYRGVVCRMAAFTTHCAFGFSRRATGMVELDERRAGEALGQFGRITRLSDLPSDTTLKRAIRAAAALNEADAAADAPDARPARRRAARRADA